MDGTVSGLPRMEFFRGGAGSRLLRPERRDKSDGGRRAVGQSRNRPESGADAASSSHAQWRSRGEALPLKEIRAEDSQRVSTGISEMDRVLGGGIVPGSLVLVGGDPGIGKSTLLLQVCRNLTLPGVQNRDFQDSGLRDAAAFSMPGTQDVSPAGISGRREAMKVLYVSSFICPGEHRPVLPHLRV